MEDERTQHNHLNLFRLNLPSSSSSSLISPPDPDSLLGFFNHGTINHDHNLLNYPPLITNSTTYTHFPSSSASFMVAPEISPSSNVQAGMMAGGKRRKMMNKGGQLCAEMEKPREVIHVRAKRGQATDSHSLAERVRRERINDKLKILQDLVPGCYKTMGMAVMLDVIINYVRSLQNQIEFLSVKLSAASMFYDFNSPEAEAMEALHRTNTSEAKEMERIMREEVLDQVLASSDPAPAPAPANHDHLHSTWPF